MEEKWNYKFAQRLETIRKELRLTKGQLAEAMQASQRSMTGYLKGSNEPKPSCLAALCKNKNVSAHWLLLGDGTMFARHQDHNSYTLGNSWANQIQETVDGYTHGLAPLSQILSALWHTIGFYIETEDLRHLQKLVQTKDKEPDASELHRQAAKELYELKATLEQTEMDPADMKTLYRHVINKHYGSEGAFSSLTKEKPSRRADDDQEQGS